MSRTQRRAENGFRTASALARRLARVSDPDDKAIVWLVLWYVQTGSLGKLAQALRTKYSSNLGTSEMLELGKRPGQHYSAAEVRIARNSMPADWQARFPLRGESVQELSLGLSNVTDAGTRYDMGLRSSASDCRAFPKSYPVQSLLDACAEAAELNLEKDLASFCMDQGGGIDLPAPWYFKSLVNALRDYSLQLRRAPEPKRVVTTVGRLIEDELEYTLAEPHTQLLEGRERIGKSFTARTWCERNAGVSRFTEVPTGNDLVGLLRALARDVGIEAYLSLSVSELRDRVEDVLLSSRLLICFDEAQRLWGDSHYSSYPRRVAWVMSLANHRIPICLISTPQFVDEIKESRERARWNSAQLLGRIERKQLPSRLSIEDLLKIVEAQLPGATPSAARAIAAYAEESNRYLGAIEAICRRTRYTANNAGRGGKPTTEDVRNAMISDVIPADTSLVEAIGLDRRSGRQPLPAPHDPPDEVATEPTPARPPAGRMTKPVLTT